MVDATALVRTQRMIMQARPHTVIRNHRKTGATTVKAFALDKHDAHGCLCHHVFTRCAAAAHLVAPHSNGAGKKKLTQHSDPASGILGR
jgi:hypothetical protein